MGVYIPLIVGIIATMSFCLLYYRIVNLFKKEKIEKEELKKEIDYFKQRYPEIVAYCKLELQGKGYARLGEAIDSLEYNGFIPNTYKNIVLFTAFGKRFAIHSQGDDLILECIYYPSGFRNIDIKKIKAAQKKYGLEKYILDLPMTLVSLSYAFFMSSKKGIRFLFLS